MFTGFILSAIVILLDQLSKYFVFGTLSRSIIGNFLWFQSEKNTGAAFSFFSGNNIFFIILVSISSILIIWLILSKKILKTKLQKTSLGIILGGTIGNLIDRLIYGYVRDFIYLKFINFAIFNIADFAITIGAVLFAISILFTKEDNVKYD